MHDPNLTNLDINLPELSKIEGGASLKIKVRNNKIVDLKFSITEWKRFYTQAIKGKPIKAIPQLVDRICGTCSNAHLLTCIEAIEKGLGITPSPQTTILRKLLYYGLIIRDHALHLYIFVLPDIYGKNSILDFDRKIPLQKKLLEDAFAVKEVGNKLSIIVGGRSVHSPYPTIGGFIKLPLINQLKKLKADLLAIRPKVLKLIQIFTAVQFDYRLNFPTIFSALVSDDFSFLEGTIKTISFPFSKTKSQTIREKNLSKHLDRIIIPYSQASGFKFDHQFLVVGALARLNVSKQTLHPKTKKTAQEALSLFPSDNLFHNNLAQAIEILQAIDASIELIDKLRYIKKEPPIRIVPKKSIGIGVIEAPRGTLYYKLYLNANGTVKKGDIIVPTGQNQIIMEKAIYELVKTLIKINLPKNKIVYEVEKLIRAFDPCMSCAAHFIKVDWQ